MTDCSVSLRSWMNQWNCSEGKVQAQGLGKMLQIWALKCGTCLIIPEKCCNHRSKRIEAVRFHRYSCGSSNERVCNRSVRTTLYMQLTENKTTEARNIRIHHLTFLKAKNAVILSLEPADLMAKATLKQLWKRFNVFYMASDCIWTFGAAGTQIELQRVQVNQCQFCVV